MKLKDGSEIKGENVSWSPPIGPTAYWALVSAHWSGEPNPNTVGGPLSHSTYKREVGIMARATRFNGAAAIPPTVNLNWSKLCYQRRETHQPHRRHCSSTGLHLHRAGRLLHRVTGVHVAAVKLRRAKEPYYGSTVTQRYTHSILTPMCYASIDPDKLGPCSSIVPKKRIKLCSPCCCMLGIWIVISWILIWAKI